MKEADRFCKIFILTTGKGTLEDVVYDGCTIAGERIGTR